MRILWLKTELLHPIDKGGKIRTYNMLKQLKKDHHITYLTLDDGTADPDARDKASEYCQEVLCVTHRSSRKFDDKFYWDLLANLFSPRPYAVEKYESLGMRQALASQIKTVEFDVLVCDFLAPAVNVPTTLPLPAILFQHNVEAMIWKRHFEMQRNVLKKAYLWGQWKKMVSFEKNMCRRFDAVIAVSEDDRERMKRDYSIGAVFDVPTGVDTDFFRPAGHEELSPYNLVFTGSMDWLPNEDAIRYFSENVLPIVKESIPQVTLTVVGRNPYPALVRLAERDPAITVTGRVEDVRPYIERAAVYVVPLRIGGGTRLKIFEAMAMERPIVSTTIGAEGLPVTGGVGLLLADEPEAFAAAIVRLLQQPSYASDLAKRGASIVREMFGWEVVAKSFAAICEERIRNQGTSRSATAPEPGCSESMISQGSADLQLPNKRS